MLRIIQNSTAGGAKSYYSTSGSGYYREGQELAGMWRGRGAERLGLSGEIEKVDWDALCDNRNPVTGKTLTLRQKVNRRVGYDFNFHVPKSVSLLYGITRDNRVLAAFRESVGETMRDIESEMQTRVRSGGRNADRPTRNMVWGEHIHTTARPVNGVPDPHLHAHCFVFNTTWDNCEGRWKAGQFASLKRDAPYFEALFHARMATRMQELGLPVVRTRTGWELEGLTAATLRKFSRRTALIEELARDQGIVDPVAKGELGAKTREKKQKALSMEELRREWGARMNESEHSDMQRLVARLGGDAVLGDDRLAAEAVLASIDHCFERNSVTPERTLLAQALKRGTGTASAERVTELVGLQPLLVVEREGRRYATTKAVLSEEQRMVTFAREGRGAEAALAAGAHVFQRDWLNDGQRKAVAHVLNSHDHVILVRGAAGTGKTSMMKEAVGGIEAAGHHVFVFAPSAEASRGVLREQEGFAEADTVARLLVDEALQERVRGQVIWVDEAGLLGTRAMTQVFDLAERLKARVVLSGDRRQHGSVERGAALRLLESEAGLVPAEIKEIQRQKGEYKAAVEAFAQGNVAGGVRQLDRLGWVREAPEAERYRLLARDYLETVSQGKSALVVSPTHREGARITEEIRAGLASAGQLKGAEREIPVLESLNYTKAERGDGANYLQGDVLVFHQNAKGFTRSQRVTVGTSALPLDQAARFQAFRTGSLKVAAGDVLRITRNGTTADGKHRLNNGAIVKVKSFSKKGDLVLANGWTVARDFGHLAYGYVATSHASEGKTVQRVLIGQSAESLPASSREQIYVSVSRGREQAVIYTDDKKILLAAVNRSEDRVTATELVRDMREMARRPRRTPAETRRMLPIAEPAEEREADNVRG